VAAVRALGLTKRFETTVALERVDLSVNEGQVHGLLGPNGAGKTTLLRLLFGLVKADEGSVELFGRPLDPNDPASLDGVSGFVENPTFYPYLSGQTNLELLVELDGSGATERVHELLERLGLTGRAGDRVSGYSTGMRQRLGIAAALLRSPRLLLLDEPTAGLDPAGVRDMGGLLNELSSGGTAVLISSHQITEIEDVCDAFTMLRRGRTVWDGTAVELREQAPGSAHAMRTSDDRHALELAERQPGITAVPGGPAGGLTLTAEEGALDAFVLALGRAGVAVRELELRSSPLESMFFALTGSEERAGTA
jgi:ABC-2 type transport system ATP-binding protein